MKMRLATDTSDPRSPPQWVLSELPRKPGGGFPAVRKSLRHAWFKEAWLPEADDDEG